MINIVVFQALEYGKLQQCSLIYMLDKAMDKIAEMTKVLETSHSVHFMVINITSPINGNKFK